MRGYVKEEHTKGKCSVCGKYSNRRLNKKCKKCHDQAVYPIFKRMFAPFIQQEKERNMSQEEYDKIEVGNE